MSAKSKLTLLLELKNKLFNNKLSATKKKFGKVTDDMGNKLNRLKSRHLKAFTAMREESALFGRAMDLMGNPYALIAAGLIALGVLFAKSYGEAKKFNHEFLQIQQLNLDKPKEDLKLYKELIRGSAMETGKSASDTAKSYYDLQSSLGVYGKEAKTIFTAVANYSTATGADLNDSINSTTKAMKAFNLGANDTQKLLESNAKTVQVGITTYKELAKVQTEYAGAASGSGQSMDTANKIFAAFTSIAKDSNIAANMTKTAFEGLTQASTVKGLKSIGISLYDAQGNMRELDKVLREVNGKFENMSPKEIDELINKIGGPEGLRNLFVKLKTGSEDFFKTLEAYDSSKFDLDEALKNAKGDVTVLTDIVGNQLNTVLGRLGEMILPTVAIALNAISKFLTMVYDNWDDIKEVLYGVAGGLAVYLGYLASLKIITIASTVASYGLTGALALVQLGLRGIGAAISSIPIIGWIAAAVGALIVLYQKWDKFRAAVNVLGDLLGDFFKGLWESAKKVIGGLVDQFMGLGKIIEGIFTADWDTIKEGAGKFAEGVKKQFKGGVEILASPVTQDYGKFGKKYNAELSDIRAKEKEKEDKEENLLGTGGSNEELDKLKADLGLASGGNGDGTNTGEAINKVTGDASKSKNITVQIDAFNKGGINTNNTTLAHKSAEEIEAWFNEMMMRVIRNLELS